MMLLWAVVAGALGVGLVACIVAVAREQRDRARALDGCSHPGFR